MERYRPKIRAGFLPGLIPVLIAALAVSMLGYLPAEELLAEKGDTPAKPEEDARKTMERKLKTIVFPAIDFTEAKIKDAIEFLRIRSADLDKAEADPALRGVNILLLPNPAWDEVRITMKLRAISLGDAIKLVAELADAQVRVDPNAVVISKKP